MDAVLTPKKIKAKKVPFYLFKRSLSSGEIMVLNKLSIGMPLIRECIEFSKTYVTL